MTERNAAPDFKILIVDDNDNNRFTLRKHLKRIGYTNLVEAADGAEALEKVENEEVHLVLCDIMMPVMDGFQVLERLKKDEKHWRTPVIMISAIDEMESVVKCIELGAEDYLSKPFNRTLLEARVNACFERQRLRTLEHRYIEYHEPVTGLYNRKMLHQVLTEKISQGDTRRNALIVIQFSIDQMKNLVGTIGPDAFDELTKIYADRFSESFLPPDEIMGALGKAEFILIPRSGLSNSQLRNQVDEIRMLVRQPVTLGDIEIIGTASIGICIPKIDENASAEAILREADLAMENAIDAGGDRFQISDNDMQESMLARLKLETGLRRCVTRNELEMYYQPIICAKTTKVSGFEALMRWVHPTIGLISPGQFIPIAEETGAICDMGSWALQTTAEQMASWETDFPDLNLTMNVNVSARQFMDRDILKEVDLIFERVDVPTQRLKLEITESVFLDDPNRMQYILEQLEVRQIPRALDDFGTGFSSLSYLHRFPITTLKIDRSFIQDVHKTPRNAEITSAIVTLARNLGMDTVAEGVETEEEFKFIQGLGIDYAQGYYFARPMPVDEATDFLGAQGKTVQ